MKFAGEIAGMGDRGMGHLGKVAVRRNGAIDLLRLLFIGLVMCFHTGKCAKGGFIGVEFFFLVSGFLMAKSMDRQAPHGDDLGKGTIAFILRKSLGIFPYYIVAWALSFIATSVVQQYSSTEILKQIILSPYNLFMVEMSGNFDMGHRIQGSWYISTMMLSMFILYPIRKTNESLFDRVIAPLQTLFFVGYCYQNGGSTNTMVVHYDPNLHVYDGMIRGIGEISLGCTCASICERLNTATCSRQQRTVLWLIELAGYLATVAFAFINPKGAVSLALVFWLAVSITLTFSNISLLAFVPSNSFVVGLGKFSLMLYLTHEFTKNQVMKAFNLGTLPISQYLAIFFGLTTVFALVVMLVGDRIKPRYREIVSQFD